MPRVRLSGTVPDGATEPFDLCARCVDDPVAWAAAARRRLGREWPADVPLALDRIPHGSYDFSPRPVPCWVCARILDAGDD